MGLISPVVRTLDNASLAAQIAICRLTAQIVLTTSSRSFAASMNQARDDSGILKEAAKFNAHNGLPDRKRLALYA